MKRLPRPVKCAKCGKREPLRMSFPQGKWLCFKCSPEGKLSIGLMGIFAGMDELRKSVNYLESV